VGRLPGHRVPRSRRRAHPEPRPQAAEPLLPRTREGAGRAAARGCILDGEIVVAGPAGLDFDALQQRIHPAPSRIARLSKETPAGFVAFDLLAAGGKSTMALPQKDRRVRLERLLGRPSRRCT
jgi:ATP-dependent DNA ligase